MSVRVAATIRAEALPPELSSQFAERPIPGTRFRVTAEPVEESEEEKLAALRADIQLGLDQLDAGLGRPLDVEALLKRLHAEHDRKNA